MTPAFIAYKTRLLVVGLLFVAWFSATNHCALERWIKGTGAEQVANRCSRCSEVPAGQQAPGEMRECCQVLKATVAENGTSVSPIIEDGLAIPFAGDGEHFARMIEAIPVPFGPESPPRVLSFAERVLQESLPGLAPPALI